MLLSNTKSILLGTSERLEIEGDKFVFIGDRWLHRKKMDDLFPSLEILGAKNIS